MNDEHHSFVVPAYGFSPYLRECLASLFAQSLKSEIIVVTSTPNQPLSELCAEFGLAPKVHSPNCGIGNDWNQALQHATTQYVTIAHQDDRYYGSFTERTLEGMARVTSPVLAFTDYEEFTDTSVRPRSRLLMVKKVLLELGFLGQSSITSRISKTNALRFACPIPCPAVTLNTAIYDGGFDQSYEVNLDWATWLSAARHKGAFVWVRETLMGHRIHATSETSAAILDGRRKAEDLRILSQLWPLSIARAIANSYAAAYASNETT